MVIAIMAGCATVPTTAMEECPAAGCDGKSEPFAKELRATASRELQCREDGLAVRDLDQASVSGPWEVDGCGRRATFEVSRRRWPEAVVRVSPVVAD
jgi:hypothetical protein